MKGIAPRLLNRFRTSVSNEGLVNGPLQRALRLAGILKVENLSTYEVDRAELRNLRCPIHKSISQFSVAFRWIESKLNWGVLKWRLGKAEFRGRGGGGELKPFYDAV